MARTLKFTRIVDSANNETVLLFTPQLVIYNKFTAAEPLLNRVNLLCDNISTCVNKYVACRMLAKLHFCSVFITVPTSVSK